MPLNLFCNSINCQIGVSVRPGWRRSGRKKQDHHHRSDIHFVLPLSRLWLKRKLKWNVSERKTLKANFVWQRPPFYRISFFLAGCIKKQELEVIKWYSIMFVWWRKNAHHFYVDRLQEISSSADLQNSRIDFFQSLNICWVMELAFHFFRRKTGNPPSIYWKNSKNNQFP